MFPTSASTMTAPAATDPPMPDRPAGLMAVFAGHPVACNLLMAIMLLAGAWGRSPG